MASDEDNFDIDIYGDGEIDMGNDGNMDYKQEDEEASFAVDAEHVHLAEETAEMKADPEQKPTPAQAPPSQVKTEEAQPNGGTTADKPTPAPTQGVKRKETSDERPVDHGATNALMISDLHWWITEDDIRGWANEAGAEDELREITFSELKLMAKAKAKHISNSLHLTQHKQSSCFANKSSRSPRPMADKCSGRFQWQL